MVDIDVAGGGDNAWEPMTLGIVDELAIDETWDEGNGFEGEREKHCEGRGSAFTSTGGVVEMGQP